MKTKKRGFSLLEVMFAIAIIGSSLMILFQYLTSLQRTTGKTIFNLHSILNRSSVYSLHACCLENNEAKPKEFSSLKSEAREIKELYLMNDILFSLNESERIIIGSFYKFIYTPSKEKK